MSTEQKSTHMTTNLSITGGSKKDLLLFDIIPSTCTIRAPTTILSSLNRKNVIVLNLSHLEKFGDEV